tara:strand:- start:23 stop:235 length:213 start_codon:yes stop_codon:yes gene_type:complete
MPQKAGTTISAWVDPQVKEALKKQAEENHLRPSAMAAIVLADYVEKKRDILQELRLSKASNEIKDDEPKN